MLVQNRFKPIVAAIGGYIGTYGASFDAGLLANRGTAQATWSGAGTMASPYKVVNSTGTAWRTNTVTLPVLMGEKKCFVLSTVASWMVIFDTGLTGVDGSQFAFEADSAGSWGTYYLAANNSTWGQLSTNGPGTGDSLFIIDRTGGKTVITQKTLSATGWVDYAGNTSAGRGLTSLDNFTGTFTVKFNVKNGGGSVSTQPYLYEYASVLNGKSSEFGGAFLATMVLGLPTLSGYGDVTGSWTVNGSTAGQIDWIDVSFPTLVGSVGCVIHKNNGWGFIKQIEAYVDGAWIVVWNGVDNKDIPSSYNKSEYYWASTKTNRLKVTVQRNSNALWHEIDAIKLLSV